MSDPTGSDAAGPGPEAMPSTAAPRAGTGRLVAAFLLDIGIAVVVLVAAAVVESPLRLRSTTMPASATTPTTASTAVVMRRRRW